MIFCITPANKRMINVIKNRYFKFIWIGVKKKSCFCFSCLYILYILVLIKYFQLSNK